MAEIAVRHAASMATHQPGIRSNRRRTTFVQLRKIGLPPQVALQCRSDGPPRMVARSTWSGRERSSHSRFPSVPRVRLVPHILLPHLSRQVLVTIRVTRYTLPTYSGNATATATSPILLPFCDWGHAPPIAQNNDPCCIAGTGARRLPASIHSPAAVATPASIRLPGNIGPTAAT